MSRPTNAHVGADVAQVTPLIAGQVIEVLVQDAAIVRRGDVLVRLDSTDARLALAQAEAALANAERRVRGLVATNAGLAGQVAARGAGQSQAAAQVIAARADLENAQIDLNRRESLAASGSVSGEELTTARNAMTTATTRLRAAQAMQQLASANQASAMGTRRANGALIENTPPPRTPTCWPPAPPAIRPG